MTDKNVNKKWLSSKEVMSISKIKGCDLMHYRLQGKLEYEKRGNSYFYAKKSIEKLKSK